MELRKLAKEVNLPVSEVEELLKDASMRCLENIEPIKFIEQKTGVQYVEWLRYFDRKNNVFYNSKLEKFFKDVHGKIYPEDKVEKITVLTNYNCSRPKTEEIVLTKEEVLKGYAKDCVWDGLYLNRRRSTVVYVVGKGFIDDNLNSYGGYQNKGFERLDLSNYVKLKKVYWPKSLTTAVYSGEYFTAYYLTKEITAKPEKFWICPECGKTYLKDESFRECTCQRMTIYSYHGFREETRFLKTENENTEMYFGTEIESCGPDSNSRFVKAVKDIFHLERDGSIGQGFEMISMPMTWNYIKENKSRIEDCFENLKANGQRSHDTDCCGLHIHVSRKAFNDEKAIAKFVAMIHRLQLPMETFARRKSGRYHSYGWCEEAPTKEDIQCIDKYGHSVAVNCGTHSHDSNSSTIEVRIFKGTLSINTYLASIELIKNMVEIVNNEHKLHVSFKDLVYGEYVPSYIKEREENYNAHFNFEASIDFCKYDYEALNSRLIQFKQFKNMLKNTKLSKNTLLKMIEKEGGLR